MRLWYLVLITLCTAHNRALTLNTGVAQPGGGGGGGGAGPALAGPILILSLKYVLYITFLNPKEVAVYVQCITT